MSKYKVTISIDGREVNRTTSANANLREARHLAHSAVDVFPVLVWDGDYTADSEMYYSFDGTDGKTYSVEFEEIQMTQYRATFNGEAVTDWFDYATLAILEAFRRGYFSIEWEMK